MGIRVNEHESLTLKVRDAELTVETKALFDAWIEKHLGQQVARQFSPGIPPARPGERYITSLMQPDGRMRHVFLLPGEAKKNWSDGMAWAKEQGGDLPDRIVFAFLKTYMPEEFKKEAYWMNEQHADDSDYAWYQSFGNGYQGSFDKLSGLLVRAVRSEYSVIQ